MWALWTVSIKEDIPSASGRGLVGPAPVPRQFQWLGMVTVLFVYAQVALGAAVRVSGSGLGCGNQWPLCHGRLIAPGSPAALIEYAHRLVGSIAGLLLIVTLVAGWWIFRRTRPIIVWLLGIATGLILIEGALGALVVFKGLSGFLVLAHLAVALALLGILVTVVILAAERRVGAVGPALRRMTLLSAALTYGVVMTGAVVVATNADTTCRSWPLCPAVVPPDALGYVTTMHRVSVAALAVVLVFTLWRAFRDPGSARMLRPIVVGTAVVLLIQMAVGLPAALNPGSAAETGLHVAVASALWVCTVVLAVVARTARPAALSIEGGEV